MQRVKCPHCGAENPKSLIVTVCHACAGSLVGAEAVEEAPAREPRGFGGTRLISLDEPPARPPVLEPAAPVGPREAVGPGRDLPPPRMAPGLPTVPPVLPPPAPSAPPVVAAPPVVPARPARPGAPPGTQNVCPNCRAANPPASTRCLSCGVELPAPPAPLGSSETRACPRCALRQPAGRITCERCGLHFADVKQTVTTLRGRPGSYSPSGGRYVLGCVAAFVLAWFLVFAIGILSAIFSR